MQVNSLITYYNFYSFLFSVLGRRKVTYTDTIMYEISTGYTRTQQSKVVHDEPKVLEQLQ
jgi:hypothetical protein